MTARKNWVAMGIVLPLTSVALLFLATNVDAAPGDEATLVAYSIVCDDESLLPNWGEWGAGGGDDRQIDPGDITEFIAASNGQCRMESGWNFEWGNEYPYPESTVLGYSGAGTSFGSTDEAGVTTTQIPAEVSGDSVWIRFQPIVGYLGYNGKTEDETFAAEFYCHTDLWHYDNLEVIHPEVDETYYCVSFTALDDGTGPDPDPEPDPTPDPEPDPEPGTPEERLETALFEAIAALGELSGERYVWPRILLNTVYDQLF